MEKLNCQILNRSDLAIKASFECFDWDINRDYLLNEKSYFVPFGSYQANAGDFLIAKRINGEKDVSYTHGMTTYTGIKPFYTGVINGFDNTKINVCDIYSLFDFDVIGARDFASDFGFGIHTLANWYFFNDISKLPPKNLIFDVVNIPGHIGPGIDEFLYLPVDPPVATNMIDLFVSALKNNDVVCDAELIARTDDGNNVLVMTMRKIDKNILLKNNVFEFLNWNLYISPTDNRQANKLYIVDKNTQTMWNQSDILDIWYTRPDGTITQDPNDGVYFPTTNKIYFYDDASASDPNAPTFQMIAVSELAGSVNNHEISFDMTKENNMVSYDDLVIGSKAQVIYNGILYNTILTGYEIKANSPYITLKFGYIRSTFQQVINDILRK